MLGAELGEGAACTNATGPGGICPAPATPFIYGVDTANPSEYSGLAARHINTAVVAIEGGNVQAWRDRLAAAEQAGLKLLVWPLGAYQDSSGVPWRWQNGRWDLSAGLPALQYAEQYVQGGGTALLGVMSLHEPFWSSGLDPATADDQLRSLYAAMKAAAPHVPVFSFIDKLSAFEANSRYEITNGMCDICITWMHAMCGRDDACQSNCRGGEGTCAQLLQSVANDRQLITQKQLDMKLVFAIQTFAAPGGYTFPTRAELDALACRLLREGKLDGLIYYTWGKPASSYTRSLKDVAAYHDVLNRVFEECQPAQMVRCSSDRQCPAATSSTSSCSGSDVVVLDTTLRCLNPGTPSSTCAPFTASRVTAQCPGGCAGGQCQTPQPNCADGLKNGVETGIDCGGPCLPCAPVQTCATDADADGYKSDAACPAGSRDCADTNADIYPGAPERCGNGQDDDCDAVVDDGCPCSQPHPCDTDCDGVLSAQCGGPDCQDGNAAIRPNTTEHCGNGIDDNCDTHIDAQDPSCRVPGPCDDADRDGYGAGQCAGPPDCDDHRAAIRPGAIEVCGNGVDENCDGIAQACAATPECEQGLCNSSCAPSWDCGPLEPLACPPSTRLQRQTCTQTNCPSHPITVTKAVLCVPSPGCGNGRPDAGEDCDGNAGKACRDINPAWQGRLGCRADCRYDTAHCCTTAPPSSRRVPTIHACMTSTTEAAGPMQTLQDPAEWQAPARAPSQEEEAATRLDPATPSIDIALLLVILSLTLLIARRGGWLKRQPPQKPL